MRPLVRCNRFSATIVCAVMLSLIASNSVRSDGLQHLRDEAATTGGFPPDVAPSPSERRDTSNNYDRHRTNYSDDEGDDDALDPIYSAVILGAVAVASSPFWIPATVAGDDYVSPAYFPRYPYQEPIEGYMMIAPDVPRKPREWSGRAYFEYGEDFADLTAWNGGLLVETTSRFGVDSQSHYFLERIGLGQRDSLWQGDANLTFRFAQSSHLVMRAGGGFNWLSRRANSEYGFNLTYGGDWYPIQPLILSAEIDWGGLGHANLFHGRVTAGLEWHRAEVYTGYEYLDVGNAQLNTWIIGFRVWF